MATITSDYTHYTCSEYPICLYSTTGRCAKGHTLGSNCPFLTDDHDDLDDDDLEGDEAAVAAEARSLINVHDTDDLDDDNSENEVTGTTSDSDAIYFGSGKALPESNIERITYAFPTKLILIIGGPNCGKTTLVASIFDSFQEGPLGKFIFAGSQTQVGFEERCHTARLSSTSKRVNPETERTKSADFFYLHLAIRDKSLLHKAQHLLFTDVSGERFRNARDTDADMNQLIILKKADHIFYMVDGETLSNITTRSSTRGDVFTFLKRAIQANLLTKDNKLTILINKFDKVIKNSAEEKIKSFFINPLNEQFSEIIEDVLATVARPSRDSDSTKTQNLDAFLDLCTRNAEVDMEASSYDKPVISNPREFTLFFSK